MGEAYIGVDVGTGSARAGVFDDAGRLLASAKRPIAIWREAGEVVEQSSQDIWRATTDARNLSGSIRICLSAGMEFTTFAAFAEVQQ